MSDHVASEQTNRGLGQHLDAVTSWAHRLATLDGAWQPAAQQLHLRVSSRGIRLVDLHPERPQLDRGKLDSVAGLAAQFGERLNQPLRGGPGRGTPEKSLQSWLILDAYRHGRIMAALSPELTFVTDELVLPSESKRVCDLLALRTTSAGERPVVIELKSAREMKRLVEQLSVADLVDAESARFEALFGAILGRAVRFQGACEKWLVWPMLAGRDDEPRVAELAGLGIIVVGYRQAHGTFKLRVGRSVGGPVRGH